MLWVNFSLFMVDTTLSQPTSKRRPPLNTGLMSHITTKLNLLVKRMMNCKYKRDTSVYSFKLRYLDLKTSRYLILIIILFSDMSV